MSKDKCTFPDCLCIKYCIKYCAEQIGVRVPDRKAKVDTRIAYGAMCSWWDSIDKVGQHRNLPCCPHCHGVLYEVQDEATWFKSVDEFAAKGFPDYRAMIEWSRGKCFANYQAVRKAYDEAIAKSPPLFPPA